MKDNSTTSEPLCVQRARALSVIVSQNAATRAARQAELDSIQFDALLAEKDPAKAQQALEDHARISTLLAIAARTLAGAREKANALAREIVDLIAPYERAITEMNHQNVEGARNAAARQLAPYFDENHLPAAVQLSKVFLAEVFFASNHRGPISVGCEFGDAGDGKTTVECRSLPTLLAAYDHAKATAEAIKARAEELPRTLR